MVGSTEPQEGATPASVATVSRTGGVPSCDSPELAAIRFRVVEDEVRDGDAGTLLEMFDKLTIACDAADRECVRLLRCNVALVKERDDLRAKLASVTNQLATGCTPTWCVMSRRKREPQEGAPLGANRSADSQDSAGVSTRKDEARGVPSCDSPELAAIRQKIKDESVYEDGGYLSLIEGRVLLRMVDELTTKLAITNLCIVWDAEYPREAELLTECRRQEERAERAEEALSDKAHLLKAFALLKDRVKVLEADLETANHWRHKANEALDGQANRANKTEKELAEAKAEIARLKEQLADIQSRAEDKRFQ